MVEHWWNGIWGRMARRDVWLYRHEDVPEGDPGAWELHVVNGWDWTRSWRYRREGTARAYLRHLLGTNDLGEFKDITDRSADTAENTKRIHY